MRLKSLIWKKLSIVALIVAICVMSIPYVEASTYRVNLLVAYDEEWASIATWQYAYSPERLAEIIVNTVHYRFREFGIGFRVVAYQAYDSNDSLTNVYARFDEVILEVNSNQSFNILVAFTGQLLMYRYNVVHGIADRLIGAVLVSHQYLSGVGRQPTTFYNTS